MKHVFGHRTFTAAPAAVPPQRVASPEGVADPVHTRP
ncbi:hypothetical protein BJY54_006473 [Streptomyces nodosus]|nr:hypothetical protein [Streptomyces nodosus]